MNVDSVVQIGFSKASKWLLVSASVVASAVFIVPLINRFAGTWLGKYSKAVNAVILILVAILLAYLFRSSELVMWAAAGLGIGAGINLIYEVAGSTLKDFASKVGLPVGSA